MSNCCSPKKSRDWFFVGVTSSVSIIYIFSVLGVLHQFPSWVQYLGHSVVDLVQTMSLGVVIGLVAIGFLSFVPREVVGKVMGRGDSVNGIFRATLAGLVLDLCSHGILMVGIKLYERGASLAQVMAFLVASPWNSLSLTIILASMVGIPITITFVVFSAIIAIVTGLIVRALVMKGILPDNPHSSSSDKGVSIIHELSQVFSGKWGSLSFYKDVIVNGFSEGKMVLRWLFFGVLLASVLRTVVTPDQFATYLGPSLGGLALTLVMATILEVCSEGSVPIAADLITYGGAVGNSFAFLMAGVSTDLTEIMALKDVTKSWKCSLILPLVTLPQVILLSALLNYLG